MDNSKAARGKTALRKSVSKTFRDIYFCFIVIDQLYAPV